MPPSCCSGVENGRSFHFLSVFFKPKQAYFNSIFDGIDFFLDEI